MTHLQPYPVNAAARAGLDNAKLSPLKPRDAVEEWCRAKGWGRFVLTQLGADYGAQLFEARWATGRYRFVTTRA